MSHFGKIQRDPNERDFSTYRRIKRDADAEIISLADAAVVALVMLQIKRMGNDLTGPAFIAWLREYEPAIIGADFRFLILRQIDARCDALRKAAGQDILNDDPDTRKTSVFFECKRILGVR